jgi:hypothetical protein
MRRPIGSARSIAIALLAFGPATVAAATRTYPGPSPCDTTLEACITGATEGDIVQLATNTPIDEGIFLDKSLTVEPAPGFTPQLGTGLTGRGVYITLSGPARTVVVRGLRFPYGGVETNTNGAGSHSITVTGCTISNTYPASSARGFLTTIRTPATVRFDHNDVVSNGYAIDFLTAAGSGAIDVTIEGNRLRKASAGLSASGIWFDLRGGFNITARARSNLIYDVADSIAGFPVALFVTTSDTAQATVDIVNNTIDQSGARGIYITAPGAGQTLVANVYNNIVTRTTLGISLPALSPGLVVSHAYNDFFENTTNSDFGGYTPGPGTVSIDPLFADRAARDYHLLGTSTLVNAATGSPPGGLSALDADGNLRVAGAGVDYGAFEFGSTPPTTTTTLGPATTTTTLPGCPSGASFPSVRCRLDELATAVGVGVPPGKLATRLGALLQTARGAVERAEQHAAAGKTRPLRKQLGRAIRALSRFVRKLQGRAAGTLDPAVRDAFFAAAAALRVDLTTLRGQ